MYENQIEIKEKRKGLVAKGLIYLTLMIISLLIAFFPILFRIKNSILFYLIGGTAFVLFLALYLFQLIKTCKPNNAIVLTSHGFTDCLNIGSSTEIEWTNVSSVKMLGKGETQFLGIVLENSDIIISRMSKSKADTMRENIEEGLPAILIAQTEIRTPIKELRDLFVRFVRESRALENTPTQKAKTNPFTSEDVLRAFGKLPPKEHNVAPEEDETKNDTSVSDNSNDSFYNILKEKTSEASEKSDTDVEVTESSINESGKIDPVNDINTLEESEEVPQEIAELLSKAKSSKISEIGKILSDNDVPYAISRQEQIDQNQTHDADIRTTIETVFEDNEEKEILISSTDSDIDNFSKNTERDGESSEPTFSTPTFIFPDEFYQKDEPESNGNPIEYGFESMVLKAFDTEKDDTLTEEAPNNSKLDTNANTVDFYPDLVFINDSDFEDDDCCDNNSTFQESEDSFIGDFITNIDDD